MEKILLQAEDFRVAVQSYDAGAVQPAHCDEESRITLVLKGRFAEDTKSEAVSVEPGDLLFKPNSAVHENHYGPEGAKLASVRFTGDGLNIGGAWSLERSPVSLRHGMALLAAMNDSDEIRIRSIVADLISLRTPPARRRSVPPKWLHRLREELETDGLEAVDVASRAREAGCHPVHASRLFRECFGLSITDYAQMHRVRRALPLMHPLQKPLSGVALDAGFCDQSHMNRVFRRLTGMTPGAYRRHTVQMAGAA